MTIGKGRPHKKLSEKLYKSLTSSSGATGYGASKNPGFHVPKKKKSF